MTALTPRAIVAELDKHIVGQDAAKRAVAIALRNRWRRAQVDQAIRNEITPKNILMIGPTGVGKTEIARRLARLAAAPFIKVEATKFTEVGYVGRDVESIIRDLTDVAIKETREREKEKVAREAAAAALERVLDILLPPARSPGQSGNGAGENPTRAKFKAMIEEGRLDDKEIEVELNAPAIGVEIMAPPGMEEMTSQLQGMFQNMGSPRKQTRRLKLKDALKLLTEEEAGQLVNEDDIKARAIERVETNTASCFWTNWTRSRAVRKPTARMSRARVCSGICCRWWKAARCPPAMAWSRPIISCLSPRARFIWPNPRT